MMKINISRQYIYLLVLSIILFVFVIIFAFTILIPKGKEFRADKVSLKKIKVEQNRHQVFHDKTFEELKELQSKNRNIITAFDSKFNSQRFEKYYGKYFERFALSEKKIVDNKYDNFDLYEVNASSKIDSPTSFYSFLEALNKGDWIVSVEFPIIFKRDEKLIHSSFKIKVYTNTKKEKITKDSNSSK